MSTIYADVHIDSESTMKCGTFAGHANGRPFASINIGNFNLFLSSAEDAARLGQLVAQAREFLTEPVAHD